MNVRTVAIQPLALRKQVAMRSCMTAHGWSRPILALLSVVLVTLAGCATMRQATLATRVDALVAPLTAANQFSGAIVLSQNGSAVYQRGFGIANHDAELAFTPDTPSDGASLAKTFTAAGVWLLVEEGRIELHAPVTRYVSDFPHPSTTVRQLLSHSNGLPADYVFFDPFFASDEVRTTQGLLSVVAKHAPAPTFQPGMRFEYSNLGFDVAALVIESVSAQNYEAFLSERFFSRLGMNDTFARPARLADWKGVRTLGYRFRRGAWQPYDVFDMEAFLGASNLYFSTADLGRWASANAAGAALPAAVVSAGQQYSLIDGKASAITGLSWYCDGGGERCYYTGSLNAFHGLVYWDRRRNESVALVANSTMPPWPLITLQRNLVEVLAGGSVRADAPVPFTAFDRDALSSVEGRYAGAEIGVVAVEVNTSGVSLRVDCGLTFGMFQVARDVFYVPGTDYWIAFSGGERPSTMHVRSMFVDERLTRVSEQAPAAACP